MCVMDIHDVGLKGYPCRIMDGKWHHYCMIWNGAYVSLTEDGVLLGAPTPHSDNSLPSVVVVNMPENERSYSTIYSNEMPGDPHGLSMLDSDEAWSASTQRAGDWMKMDLGEVLRIGGVVTQSRAATNCCGTERVTQFRIMTSEDNATYDQILHTGPPVPNTFENIECTVFGDTGESLLATHFSLETEALWHTATPFC